MNGKFYIQKLIRDDGEKLFFDEREIYLANENKLLNRSSVSSTDVEFTDADGGEMIIQRQPSFEQTINGIIFPRSSDYWNLYQRLTSFFRINHNYRIITIKKSGSLFSQQSAWIADGGGLQIITQPHEDYSLWSVTMRIGNMSLYEYSEDENGAEIFANKITLPLLSASSGGEVWDTVGEVWDAIGGLWSSGNGGVQTVSITSISKIYPVWTVKGECVNPSLQNNSTDTGAKYNGTVAAGQTLIVDFSTGEARLDGALVSRSIIGQVSCDPGDNIMGFNSDGGNSSSSTIEWNNIIG